MAMIARSLLKSPGSNVYIADASIGTTVGDFNEFLTITNTDRGIMSLLVTMNLNISVSHTTSKIYVINKKSGTGAGWQTLIPIYDATSSTTAALQIYSDATNTLRLRVIRSSGAQAITAKMRVESYNAWESLTFTASAVTGNDVSAYSEYTTSYFNRAAIAGYTNTYVVFGSSDGKMTESQYFTWNGKNLIIKDGATGNALIGDNTGTALTGSSNVAIGDSAGRYSAAVNSCLLVGALAGANLADGAHYTVAFGASAGRYITTANNIAIGNSAFENTLLKSIGNYAVGIGFNAGEFAESQTNSILIGRYAGQYSFGQSSVRIGNLAGIYSKGTYEVSVGENAHRVNVGTKSIAVGYEAGLYAASGANNIYIGSVSGSVTAVANSSDEVTFASSNIDVALNRVTVTGHGKTIGQYYSAQFIRETAMTTPGGMSNNLPYNLYVVDANTFSLDIDITSQGTGTAHKFRFFQTWSDLVLIGNGISPSKDKQIIIGSTSSDEFLTYAYFKSLSTKANFMPVGTTAQRPSDAVGQYRWNTTTSKPEFHNGTTWIDFIMSDVYSAAVSRWDLTGAHIVNNNAGKVGIVSTGVAFTPSEQLHLKDGNFRVEAGVIGIGVAPVSNIRAYIKDTTVGQTALYVEGADNTSAAFSFVMGGNVQLVVNTTTGNRNVAIGNATSSTRVTLNHRTEIISSGNTATDWPITVLDSGSNEVMKLNAVGGMVRTADTQQYQRTARIYGSGGSSTELQARYNAAVIDVNGSTDSHIHIEFDVTLTASTHQMCIWLVGVMSGTVADTPGMCDIKTTQSFDNSGLVGTTSSVSAFGHHTHTWYRSSNNKPAIKITNTVGDIGYTQLTLHVLRGAFVASGLSTAPDVAQVVFNTGTNI